MPIAGLPYAGFYNGNFEMMLANGTYADFREVFVNRVKMGKLKQEALDQMDAEWEAIDIDERMRRRDVVVADSTPREVTIMTNEGPLVKIVTTPDEGNNVHIQRQKEKIVKEKKLPKGALTAANNPLKKSVSPSKK